MLYYLIAIIIIAFDQLTKLAVVNNMELFETIPVIDGFLNLTYTLNEGAAFSILQNQRILFIILACVISVVIVCMIYKMNKSQKLIKFSFALILGGAIGNLIDRIDTGAVVDFLDVQFMDFAIFNVADSAVVVGSILMMIYVIFSKDQDNLFK